MYVQDLTIIIQKLKSAIISKIFDTTAIRSLPCIVFVYEWNGEVNSLIFKRSNCWKIIT